MKKAMKFMFVFVSMIGSTALVSKAEVGVTKKPLFAINVRKGPLVAINISYKGKEFFTVGEDMGSFLKINDPKISCMYDAFIIDDVTDEVLSKLRGANIIYSFNLINLATKKLGSLELPNIKTKKVVSFSLPSGEYPQWLLNIYRQGSEMEKCASVKAIEEIMSGESSK